MDGLTITVMIVKVLIVFGAVMTAVMAMTLAERRVSAFMQDRLGPNRVGPKGMLQPIADGIKFLMKEEIIPSAAVKPIFILAPAMLIIPALMTFAVIPFGQTVTLFGKQVALQVANVNIGIQVVFLDLGKMRTHINESFKSLHLFLGLLDIPAVGNKILTFRRHQARCGRTGETGDISNIGQIGDQDPIQAFFSQDVFQVFLTFRINEMIHKMDQSFLEFFIAN